MASKPQTCCVLDGITPDEGLAVLRTLIRRHHTLAAEAEAIALTLASSVNREAVAAEVVQTIAPLGYHELNVRAGPGSYGYVEPNEAAWEILEGAVAPFVAELERLLFMGLWAPARAQCEGMLLGLHKLEAEPELCELIPHAPDFVGESAGNALILWFTKSRDSPDLDPALLAGELLDWSDFISNMRSAAARRGH